MISGEDPTLSVVIVNWNTRDLLRRCLESVCSTVPPLSFRVIVVDNASTDGSADMVAESFPLVTLVRSDVNLGYSAGNNLGMHGASGRYVLLLNSDAELLPGSVSRMLELADLHTKVGVVGPKLLNSDGSLQRNGRIFPSFLRELLFNTKLHRLMGRRFDLRYEWGREDFDAPAQVDEVSGACMLVRGEAVEQVGMLDERFFMYYEDVDWCRRMRRAGWEVHYLPSAQVVHHAGRSAAQIGAGRYRTAYRSQYLYFRKHHGLLRAIALRVMSGCLQALMALGERVSIGNR